MKRIAAGLLLASSLAMAGQAVAGPGGGYYRGGGGYHGGGRGNVVGALLGGAVVGALVGSVMSRGYIQEAPPVVYAPPPQVVYEAPPVVYAPAPERCFDTYRRVYVACYAPQPRYHDYPPPDYYYGR